MVAQGARFRETAASAALDALDALGRDCRLGVGRELVFFFTGGVDGWRSPLGACGWASRARPCLSVAMTAAQLLPVIEFTQQTGRSSSGPREIYQFSLEPFRLLELAWPNILGMPFEGKSYWGDLIRTPGGRPKGWVPSLYLGGLTLALALSSLTIRRGPPWRVWITRDCVDRPAGKPGPVHQPNLVGSRTGRSRRIRRRFGIGCPTSARSTRSNTPHDPPRRPSSRR